MYSYNSGISIGIITLAPVSNRQIAVRTIDRNAELKISQVREGPSLLGSS